jgi:catechol 2,3-dioxygenase-like lactoylglutathione lyase family enzyme
MEHVTGIGGVFFRARDPKATREWYQKILGVPTRDFEGTTLSIFEWRELDRPDAVANTVWAVFSQDSKHLEPGNADFMINYRVRNLAAMLEQLRSAGVRVVDGPQKDFNGSFAWILDPDGRKVELWEPAEGF